MRARLLLAAAFALAACAAVAFVLLRGGGREAPGPIRPREEIFKDEMAMPALYITTSGKHVVATVGKRLFVDPESGDICWPAMFCANPDCPGRKGADEPFLFAAVEPGVVARPDGTVGPGPTPDRKASPFWDQCPACLKQRDPANETPARRAQFKKWAQLYVLPETRRRIETLAAENRRRARLDRQMRRLERMESAAERR